MPDLVDTHVHLDHASFAGDRNDVLARARGLGVRTMVVPAVDAASRRAIRSLCAGAPGLFAAYGTHPLFVAHAEAGDVAGIDAELARGDAVAVGEIGLDFHEGAPDPRLQRSWFSTQLELARAHDLPVILHARDALEEVSLIVRRTGSLRGVVHSFSGSEEQARRLCGMGFLLGLGGKLTYARARRLRRIAADVPLEFLVLESDAPDQPDVAWRGHRNEPSRVAHVAAELARLRGTTPDEVAAATSANARRLFRLPLPAASAPGLCPQVPADHR